MAKIVSDSGLNLSQAVQHFAPPELWAEYEDVAAWQANRRHRRLVIRSQFLDGEYALEQYDALRIRRMEQHKKHCSNRLWHFLLVKLQSGELNATGRPEHPNAERVPINASSWKAYRVRDWQASVIEVAGNEALCFYDVLIFQTRAAVADKQVQLRTRAETGAMNWLISEMKASPTLRPKTKQAYLNEAKKRFEGLSVRAFNRAWDRAVEHTGSAWKRAGRPRKSSRPKSPRQ